MDVPPENCNLKFTGLGAIPKRCTSQADGYYSYYSKLKSVGLCRDCYKIGLEGESGADWKSIHVVWYDSEEYFNILRKNGRREVS